MHLTKLMPDPNDQSVISLHPVAAHQNLSARRTYSLCMPADISSMLELRSKLHGFSLEVHVQQVQEFSELRMI